MTHLVGARVVRGPDWNRADQDGGEGNSGTVIPTSQTNLKLYGPGTVTVVWDSGMKFTYQAGPEGSHHLRIISCPALRLKHPNISCANYACGVQDIQGFRWQCATCGLNLCTDCFLRKIPHNIHHNKFNRYDYDHIETPALVSSWSEIEPDSRIELKGLYPGALVSLSPHWPYNEMKKSGIVIQTPKEGISAKIVVEWDRSNKERTLHEHGDGVLRIKTPGVGGFYYPAAFPSASTSTNIPSRPKKDCQINEDQLGDPLNLYDFSCISDGTKHGYVEDNMGNKFIWSGTRKDGAIGYRCTQESPLSKNGRCTAVARKILNKQTGKRTIVLESAHKHATEKRTEPDNISGKQLFTANLINLYDSFLFY